MSINPQPSPAPEDGRSCHLCQKTFSKADHLARHLQSHTQVKPYPCTFCTRSFARKDGLYRHLRVHKGTPGPSEYRRTGKKRSRIEHFEVSVATGSGSGDAYTAVSRSNSLRAQDSDYNPSSDRSASPPAAIEPLPPQQMSVPNQTEIGDSGPTFPWAQPLSSNDTLFQSTDIFGTDRPASRDGEKGWDMQQSEVLGPPAILYNGGETDVWMGPSQSVVTSTPPWHDEQLLQLLSQSTLPYNPGPEAPSQFYQSLGINVAGSVYQTMGSDFQDAQNLGSTSAQIDWVSLAKLMQADSEALPTHELSTNLPSYPSNTETDASAVGRSMGKDHSDVEHRAVKKTRELLSGLSSDFTSQAHHFSSAFLQRCLSAFFSRFVPTFPFVHPATFKAESTSAPLLVTMIAVGSLCVQSDDATRLGEDLWELGNKALAGNWEGMLSQRGEYDVCRGLSLVTSALLGQVYAVASANRKLNTNAMVTEPLAFRWARAAGMYIEVPKAKEPGSSLDAKTHGVDLDRLWHQWAAYESQKRTVMGLYYLDGQVCSLFEASPAARHRSNPVMDISYDDAFLAPTSISWKEVMLSKRGPTHPIPIALSSLFDSHPMTEACRIPDYAAAVLLEVIYSEVVESRDSPRVARQLSPLIEGLCRFQFTFLSDRTDAESLWMRWHMVSIELLELELLSGRIVRSGEADLAVWFRSPAGRRAILHAHAIAQLVDRMPFAAISAPRLSTPICAYHAGLVLMYAWKHDGQFNRARRALDSQLWEFETTVDWQTLAKAGYPGYVMSDLNTSRMLYNYLYGGSDASYRGRRFEASDISSILSALATSGATWPKASAMAKRLTAISYG